MSRLWQEYCEPANWHEAANIFPLMPDDELQKLADDIKANGGLRNPVIILNDVDKVLDGRNRLLACKLAGVSPVFEPRSPKSIGSPTAWVLSQNLHRRHLTSDQLKAVLAEAVILKQKETTERQRANLKQNQVQQPQPSCAAEVEKSSISESSRDAIAKPFGFTGRALQSSITLAKKHHAIHQLQKSGKITAKVAQAAAALVEHHPEESQQMLDGTITPRDLEKARKVIIKTRDLKARFAEKERYYRIGSGLAAAFNGVKDRLDELTHIKKADWSPEAAEGLQNLIKNLNEVAKTADEYASQFKTILKANKKVA